MKSVPLHERVTVWWRPLLTLICIPAAPYALYVGPMIGRPLTDMQMGLSLTFVATLFYIREWGKAKALEQVSAASTAGSSGYAAAPEPSLTDERG